MSGSDVGEDSILTKISKRQGEILTLYAEGKSYAQIAQILKISRHTVDQHLRRVRNVAGCDTTVQAAVRYVTALHNVDVG